jgi:hypothetical protein
MAGSISIYHLLTQPTDRECQAIEITIQTMKSDGLLQSRRSRTNAKSQLRRIAKNTDIFNPIKVKEFITNELPLSIKNNFETNMG